MRSKLHNMTYLSALMAFKEISVYILIECLGVKVTVVQVFFFTSPLNRG